MIFLGLVIETWSDLYGIRIRLYGIILLWDCILMDRSPEDFIDVTYRLRGCTMNTPRFPLSISDLLVYVKFCY